MKISPLVISSACLFLTGVAAQNDPGLYQYRPGFLAAGDDLYSGSFNFTGATDYCSSNDDCLGFTFEVPPGNETEPTTPVDVYFKTLQNYVCCDPSWASWTKTGPPDFPDINFTVGGLSIGLRPNSHTVQVMGLVDDPMPPYNFSFVPPLKAFGRSSDRSLPGCHQLGDITIRTQPLSETNTSSWAMFQTSWAGFAHNSIPQPKPWPNPTMVSFDDITPLLNATPVQNRIVPAYALPVSVLRSYEIRTDPTTNEQSLLMRFNVTALEDTRLGGFGMSVMADDNTDTNLDVIAYTNSFVDPHMGSHHSWAEWTRIVGNLSLLVLPGNNKTQMESWRPLLEDCNYNGAMSEWSVLTGAWFTEWNVQKQAPVLTMPADLQATNVWPDPKSPWPSWRGNETVFVPGLEDRQWATPTMIELLAGQSTEFALRFVLAPGGPRTRDGALKNAGEPVLHAVPGYTLSTDMNSTFLLVTPPRNLTVNAVDITPSGILNIAGAPVSLPSGDTQINLQGISRGRAKVVIRFSDDSESVAHYYVLPNMTGQVGNYGAHLTGASWLPEEYPDPFGRSAAVLPYDREDKVIVLDDSRAYIVGLSDDAGAAQNLAHAMKVGWAPVQDEVTAKDDYIALTLFGTKPSVAKNPIISLQLPDFSVRMTMYYYCSTPGNCTTSGEGWPYPYPEQDKCGIDVGGPNWCMVSSLANETYRGFNYPHQAASWYGMYRVSRFYDLMKTYQSWDYYLYGAFMTAMQVQQASVGFMDGTVFREILLALQAEGTENSTINGWASQLDTNMKARADAWSTVTFPYGSEFAYDTTGQEEVYVWLQHYNYAEAANNTLNAILGYMRLIPNWAWHGGARSTGDLGNNGKWFINRGGERILMHYRSGLNNIPVMEGYRANPDDRFLLELGMGALSGQLVNIDENGAPSMGFHSVPFMLEHDPRSGDFGCGFFGHTLESGSYLVNDATLGWLCFLCNPTNITSSTMVSYAPTDSYRSRTFIEPLALYLIAQSGNIEAVSLNMEKKSLVLTFTPALTSPASVHDHATAPYSYIYLQATKTATTRPGTGFTVTDGNGNAVPIVRGSYQITPNSDTSSSTSVTIGWT